MKRIVPIPRCLKLPAKILHACLAIATSLICLLGQIQGQGLPQVLTMNSGLQFEGELASVPAIVEGSSIFAEYDSKQIVRINDGMRLIFVSIK